MLRKLLFGVASLVLGGVFVAGYLEIHGDIAQVQRDGKAAQIEPLARYTKRTRNFMDTYTAEVRFKTDAGQAIHLPQKEVPAEVMELAGRGRPVNILYMAAEPSRARFPQESASPLILGCGLLFLVAGIAMMVGAYLGKFNARAAMPVQR